MTATPLEQRSAVHPSAELLELRILGLHVMLLLVGRSRGWRVGHSLHFALQEPGDREAGGGARAPKAAAKRLPLRRRRLSAVAPLPCPSPRHRPLVRAFSANGAGRVRRLGRVGPEERSPSTAGVRSRRYPGPARAGVPRERGGAVQTFGQRWARPVVPVKRELRRGRRSGAGPHELSRGYETLDFDQLSPGCGRN
jgi:hypothetical protein